MDKIVSYIAERLGISERRTTEILTPAIDVLRQRLALHEWILINNAALFNVKKRNVNMLIYPRNFTKILLPPCLYIGFRLDVSSYLIENREVIRDLKTLIMIQANLDERTASLFIKYMIEIISASLRKNFVCKLDGFGTFRRVPKPGFSLPNGVMPGKNRFHIIFSPEKNLQEEVNKSFSFFEPAIVKIKELPQKKTAQQIESLSDKYTENKNAASEVAKNSIIEVKDYFADELMGEPDPFPIKEFVSQVDALFPPKESKPQPAKEKAELEKDNPVQESKPTPEMIVFEKTQPALEVIPEPVRPVEVIVDEPKSVFEPVKPKPDASEQENRTNNTNDRQHVTDPNKSIAFIVEEAVKFFENKSAKTRIYPVNPPDKSESIESKKTEPKQPEPEKPQLSEPEPEKTPVIEIPDSAKIVQPSPTPSVQPETQTQQSVENIREKPAPAPDHKPEPVYVEEVTGKTAVEVPPTKPTVTAEIPRRPGYSGVAPQQQRTSHQSEQPRKPTEIPRKPQRSTPNGGRNTARSSSPESALIKRYVLKHYLYVGITILLILALIFYIFHKFNSQEEPQVYEINPSQTEQPAGTDEIHATVDNELDTGSR
ncbi:MAG: hypothetical protein LBD45_08530, partial [Bacteroidales bacterium]|nr:hypothetical protein [Bacteroidales bacterium]